MFRLLGLSIENWERHRWRVKCTHSSTETLRQCKKSTDALSVQRKMKASRYLTEVIIGHSFINVIQEQTVDSRCRSYWCSDRCPTQCETTDHTTPQAASFSCVLLSHSVYFHLSATLCRRTTIFASRLFLYVSMR
jgi:hypothetical protein